MFTFKKEPKETGLASIGNPNPNTIIKLQKKEVGSIVGPDWRSKDDLWRVRLMVKDQSHFKWVTLKQTFENEPDARKYLKENFEKIQKLNLHCEEIND